MLTAAYYDSRGKEPVLLVPQLLTEHLLPWPKCYAPSTRISGNVLLYRGQRVGFFAPLFKK
jgi:hypothetical protein